MKYKDLLKKHTPAELAEAFVFPVKLTKKQQAEADKALREARLKARKEMTAETQLQLDLYNIKFRMEDAAKATTYTNEHSFGNFLRKYIAALGKKQKDFAEEISITPTELSQLLNGHRKPNEDILIRLEIHSGKMLPALLWYRILEKEKEHVLLTDLARWKRQRKRVKHSLAFAS